MIRLLMNTQIFLIFFLVDIFYCAKVPLKSSGSFLKWSNNITNSGNEASCSVSGCKMTKVAPDSAAVLGSKTIPQPPDINNARKLFPPWLLGGNNKIAPIDVTAPTVKQDTRPKNLKVSPDYNVPQVKHLSAIDAEENENLKTDSTTTISLDSPMSYSGQDHFFANELSEREVDLLYGDCMKFIEKGKFLFFRFALIKIKPYISDMRLLTLLEKATILNRIDCVEFFFENFDQLSTLPSNIIFTALDTRNSDIFEVIINNRTVADQDLNGYSHMRPYEIAAMINHYKAMKMMLNSWSKTKLQWLPKVLKIAIIYQSIETIKAVITNLIPKKIKGSLDPYTKKTLNLYFNKFMLLGFLDKAVQTKNFELIKLFVKALPNDFLSSNGFFDNNISKNGFIDPVRRAIELDFEEGLEFMVKHFGIDIVKKTNDLGYSAFLVAAQNLSPKTAKYIAKICPDQIQSTDKTRNNALHVALSNVDSKPPMEFIKQISDLRIDWDQRNLNGKSAFNLLNQHKNITEEDIRNIKQNIFENLMK